MASPTQERRSPGRPPDLGLLERRRIEILEIATLRFAQHGFTATDMQLVADELGVGKGTIYRYFVNKEDLFLAAVDQGMRRLTEHLQERTKSASSPIESIELAVKAYLEYFDRHPEVIELLIQERAYFREREKPTYFAHRDANLESWKDLFKGLIAEGQIRHVPVERITDVISDLLYGTIFTNHFAKRKKSLVRQCKDVLDILFNGLLVDNRRGSHE